LGQGAIEDFYAAQGATDVPTGSIDDQEQESLLNDTEMSQPQEENQGQNPSGSRTLGGAPADTSLPEGWGKPQKKVGRVGDWGSSAGP
jgi:hypothetical protein